MIVRLLKTREIWAWLAVASLGALLLLQHFVFRQQFEEAPAELGIDTLIAQVKRDLEASEEARLREGKAPLFKVDTFDLEIHFTVRRSLSTEAGARLEVVTLGSSADVGGERTQKITLHMKAIDANNGGSIPGSSDLVPLH
jgi:hypothetical protein